MEWVASAYWLCLLVGIGYTLVAGLLGGVSGVAGHAGHFGHMGGHGATSHDYGVGGHGGHGSTSPSSPEHGGNVIFGPFSPLVIAFFLTCFGGTGLIFSRLPGLLSVFSLPIAVASGFVLAWLLITVFNKFIGSMQSSSEVHLGSLIGADAEVTVAVPSNGIGEIAYVAMGSRCVAPARSDEAQDIPRFASVRVTRLVGNIFYVRPALEEELRNQASEQAPKIPPAERI